MVFYDLILGTLSSQSTTSDGCVSTIKWTAEAKAQINAVYAKHGLDENRDPDTELCIRLLGKLGIPVKYGRAILRACLTPMLAAIDGHGTDSTPSPSLTDMGHTSISYVHIGKEWHKSTSQVNAVIVEIAATKIRDVNPLAPPSRSEPVTPKPGNALVILPGPARQARPVGGVFTPPLTPVTPTMGIGGDADNIRSLIGKATHYGD
ncbi:hypothetical protein AC578_10034 [Pseudocercospora eumusae]|uniref:Uncharacterized protein n=1 Tax=Pseudocercospora eumusae TaxID=321146 RepID=A0A139H6M0_9PEZI|nr:hypothetical protein AC578_10034 [Pseudocercospora eumusae]